MEGAAPPPRSPPQPWLLLGFQPPLPAPQPVEAGPVLALPCLGLRNSHPFQSRGVGGGGGSKGRQGKGREACPSRHPSPLSAEQSHGFWYPPQFCSFSKLRFPGWWSCVGALGRAGVPERANTRRVSEATETLPQCILPHRAGFQGFFKAAGEKSCHS